MYCNGKGYHSLHIVYIMQASFWIKTGAIAGALAVVAGAFGAHGLQGQVDAGNMDSSYLHTFETAVRYHFYHAGAILLTVALSAHLSPKRSLLAMRFFLAGLFLFSGSLYILSLSTLFAGDALHWMGAITPLGGLAFIAGWITLGWSVIK